MFLAVTRDVTLRYWQMHTSWRELTSQKRLANWQFVDKYLLIFVANFLNSFFWVGKIEFVPFKNTFQHHNTQNVIR